MNLPGNGMTWKEFFSDLKAELSRDNVFDWAAAVTYNGLLALFPFMLFLLVVISVILHLALPVNLVQWSANMSNLGALIYPFLLMYLNSRLPRPARPRPWHYVLLVANVRFFGFFFVNFVADFVGDPLVTF